MMKLVISFYFLTSCLILTGCKDKIESMKLNIAEKERVLELQNPFGENLIRLKSKGSEKFILMGLRGCKLYRAEPEQGVVTEWLRVESIDSHNFLGTGCDKQSLTYDGNYIYFNYCIVAIGAGGGCGGGYGQYRSNDGISWEKMSPKNQWVPVKN